MQSETVEGVAKDQPRNSNRRKLMRKRVSVPNPKGYHQMKAKDCVFFPRSRLMVSNSTPMVRGEEARSQGGPLPPPTHGKDHPAKRERVKLRYLNVVEDDEEVYSSIGVRPGQLTTVPAPLDDASVNDAVTIEGGDEPSSGQLPATEEEAHSLFAEGSEEYGPPPKEEAEKSEAPQAVKKVNNKEKKEKNLFQNKIMS